MDPYSSYAGSALIENYFGVSDMNFSAAAIYLLLLSFFVMGCYAIVIEDANKRIKELEEQLRWISVEGNDPPEKDGRYLVTLNRPVVNICHWRNSHWHLGKEDVSKYVTHWMPLPEPPK
jgi:hypothetical protein